MGRRCKKWMFLGALLSLVALARVLADGGSCNATRQAACGDKCIPFAWLCNGEQDCPNGVDEQCDEACHGDKSAWQCDNGNCIFISWKCDGLSDCMDGSDERDCECKGGKKPCPGQSQCIDAWEICDGHNDCDDGSDEANCPEKSCLEHQWQCKNKVCIMKAWICDGINNCGDASDEENCVSCGEGMHRCDVKCIMESLMCDGKADCLDGTDEPSTCGSNCSLDNGGCMQVCETTTWGVKCSCRDGWEKSADGQNCTDVDECSMDYSPCNQLCKNTIGSFTCDCVEGYQLIQGTVCEVLDKNTLILLAANKELALLDVRSSKYQALTSVTEAPVAFVYDLKRETYYWVDVKTTLQAYVVETGEITQLYPDIDGVNSIAVDWLTGQLYWSSNSYNAIYAGLSDTRGYVKILEKNLEPQQLIVFPAKRCMYWINLGAKGNTCIESAGMDGSDRRVLALVPVEEPLGLTLDYATERLYWISEYKESIETIKIDGSGRESFPEILIRDQNPLGLAFFEGWFYWADANTLLRATQDSKEMLINLTALSAFTVLHELLQPQSTSPCVPGRCSHICLPSAVHIDGFKCACPDGTFSLPSGKCGNLKLIYSSNKRIYLLEFGSKGAAVKKTLMQEWSNVNLLDYDWKRNLVYWADDISQLMRSVGHQGSAQVIPTNEAVCLTSIDIPSGNMYWLPCYGSAIMVTRFSGMGTKKLYQANTTIQYIFLDWKRGSLYWVEGTSIWRMNLAGGDVQSVWKGTELEVARVALDIKSQSFLWSSEDVGLQALSLLKGKSSTLRKNWLSGLIAAYEPYLVSVNDKALEVWDKRSMDLFATVEEKNIASVVLLLDMEKASHSPCGFENGGCRKDEICISGPEGVITCLCPDDGASCSEVSDPVVEVPIISPTPFCPHTFIKCRDGKACIHPEYMCDGEADCLDGSDEDNCAAFCGKSGMFSCLDGKKCIEESLRCDGLAQCLDGSDEQDCWKPSEDCALRCDKTRCIPKSWLCDGHPDCIDETDEEDCVREECGESSFQCANGQCIPASMRCDGDKDCNDHSDEENCTISKPVQCQQGELKCQSGECILKDWWCDGEGDCRDNSDEKNCRHIPLRCSEIQWSCESRDQCIPTFWHCDGEDDCRDGSDEVGCEPKKCESNQFQCGDASDCIPIGLVCNGARDCMDGSDEGGKCGSLCSKGTCSHTCYSSPKGPRCACERGFQLSSDRHLCLDINECKEFTTSPCSQTCINKNGTYSCTCHPGFLPEPDGQSCKVAGSEPVLLVAVHNDLITYGLRSMKEEILTTDKNLIISVDYDLVEQKVFWMDLNAESIKWVTTTAKSKGTLVKGIKSDCIAVDWIGRNIYWTDGTAGKILAARLNSTWKGIPEYTVMLDADLDQPRSLVLQPLSGLMYWSEIGAQPQIERAGMDGTNREVLIKEKLGWPTGLALDLLSWKIYWSDDKFKCIGFASLDGSRIKLIQLRKIQRPFSLAVFEDYVYWSEMKARTVQKMNKKTGKNLTLLIKRHDQPYNLKVMHEVMQPKTSNPCPNLGCSHLCLLGPGLKGSCWCPVGFVLMDDRRNCVALKESAFIYLVSSTVITQVYLKKLPSAVQKTLPEHSSLSLTSVSQLTAIDYIVQDRLLYYSVSDDGYIGLSKAKDSGVASWRRALDVEERVRSFSVDWMSGNIYWIPDRKPNIQVASSNGFYSILLISEDLYYPSALTLHPPTRVMCYADLGTEDQKNEPKIECASMDGRERKVLRRKVNVPVGLVFTSSGDRLYWADQIRGVIETIQIDGSKYKMIRGGLRGLGLFTAGEGMMFWTTSNGTRVHYSKLDQEEDFWFQTDQKIVDLKIYSKFAQQGTNDCSGANGGCSQICLPNREGRVCKCSAGYHLINDTECHKNVKCPPDSQPCKDGRTCILGEQVCNGQADCLDGSDERACEFLKVKTVSPSRTLQPVIWPTFVPPKRFPSAQSSAQAKPPEATSYPFKELSFRTFPASSPSRNSTEPEGTSLLDDLDRNIKSRPCNSKLCNNRGDCVFEDNKKKCKCAPEYTGDYCEHEVMQSLTAPLVLGTLAILLAALGAVIAFAFFKRRKALERTSSTTSSRTLTRQPMEDTEPQEVENLTSSATFVNRAYDTESSAVEQELITPLHSE